MLRSAQRHESAIAGSDLLPGQLKTGSLPSVIDANFDVSALPWQEATVSEAPSLASPLSWPTVGGSNISLLQQKAALGMAYAAKPSRSPTLTTRSQGHSALVSPGKTLVHLATLPQQVLSKVFIVANQLHTIAHNVLPRPMSSASIRSESRLSSWYLPLQASNLLRTDGGIQQQTAFCQAAPGLSQLSGHPAQLSTPGLDRYPIQAQPLHGSMTRAFSTGTSAASYQMQASTYMAGFPHPDVSQGLGDDLYPMEAYEPATSQGPAPPPM